MKLHLPRLLKSALLAACTAFAPVCTTSATGSIIVGTLVFNLTSRHAQAESLKDLIITEDASYDSITLDGTVTISKGDSDVTLTSEGALTMSVGSSLVIDENQSAKLGGFTALGTFAIENKGSLYVDGLYSFIKNGSDSIAYMNNYGYLSLKTTSTNDYTIDVLSNNYLVNKGDGVMDIDTAGGKLVIRTEAQLVNESTNDITITGNVRLLYAGELSNTSSGSILMDGLDNSSSGSIVSNSGTGDIVTTTLSLGNTTIITNSSSGNITVGAGTLSSTATLTNSGSGTVSFDSLKLTSTGLISNTGTGVLSIGSAGASSTLATGSSISNAAGGTLSLNGTIILGAESLISNYGNLVLGDELIFDVSAFASKGAGTYNIFSFDSTSSDLSGLTVAHLSGLDLVYYDFIFNVNGTITISNKEIETINYTGSDNELVLSDGLLLGNAQFDNGDNLSYDGTGSISISGAVNITDLVLGEAATLSLGASDDNASLYIHSVNLGANATLSVSDATFLSWRLDADSLVADATSRLIFTGTEQSYVLGAKLSNFSGTLEVTAGNTVSFDTMSEKGILIAGAGSTLIKTGTSNYTMNFDLQTTTDFTDAHMIVEGGLFRMKWASKLSDDVESSLKFATLTIKEGGTVDWGYSNGTFSGSKVYIFDGGTLSTYLPNNTTFDKYEVTDKGGLLSFYTGGYTGNIKFTINVLEGTAAEDGVFEIRSTSTNTAFTPIVTIGEVLNYNGTIAVTEQFTAGGASQVIINKISNELGDHTQITGPINITALSVSGAGTSTISHVFFAENASLSVDKGASLNLSGMVELSGGSSIVNNGSLSFDATSTQMDLNKLTWTSDDYITYTYQLITGEGTHNLGDLGMENILNGDAMYNYTFNADGSISYTLDALTFKGSALKLYQGATGFEGTSEGFKNGDNLVLGNKASSYTSPITVRLGNAAETGNISINQLIIGTDTHVDFDKDSNFAFALDVAKLTLNSGSTFTLHHDDTTITELVSYFSDATLYFDGQNQNYDLRTIDCSQYAGAFVLGATNSLVIAGAWDSSALSLESASTYEDATKIVIEEDTLVTKSINIAATVGDASSNYVEFDVASGVTLTNTAILTASNKSIGVSYIIKLAVDNVRIHYFAPE